MFKKITKTGSLVVFSLIVEVFFFLLKLNVLPPEIPLFYSKPQGQEVIAPLYAIFLIPFAAFIALSINLVVKRVFFRENEFIDIVIGWINNIIIVLSTGFFLKIIVNVT